ncbi:hypothetical protein YC2023_096971 [Brassica napus]
MHVLADLYMPENLQRSMMHDDMMVGAFSHSTAVGKLRKDLPDVGMLHPMLAKTSKAREVFSEENWKKIFSLANGNGSEMRWLGEINFSVN